jgi:hypothetical protein
MSSFGRVRLSTIWSMLDACAPGNERKPGKHKWCVRYGGKTFPSLPKGEHGATDPEIEIGHIKKMIRHLSVEPSCAATHIPGLKSWAEAQKARTKA